MFLKKEPKKKDTKDFWQSIREKWQNLHLKVVSATFFLVSFLSLDKSTCQIRKNVFYFTSKALFVFEKMKFQNSTVLNFIMPSNA